MNQDHVTADPLLLQMQSEILGLKAELASCRQREAEARSAARTDGLTGMPNRRVLEFEVERQLRRHATGHMMLAVLFIDLDAFKDVNDRHGHAVGDAVLRLAGLRLRHAMRRDDLACRIGGDEFVCVLQDLRHADEVATIATKLQAALAQACQLGELTLKVRASIGVAVFPRDGATLAELLAHADRAMYRHKQGRVGDGPTAVGAAAGVSGCVGARAPAQSARAV